MSSYPPPPSYPPGGLPPYPPQGYPPPHGHPPAYGYLPTDSAYAPKRLSGVAIASLITALFVPALGALLGIVLGIMGLVDAKKPGKTGRGFAVAGLCLGVVHLLVGLVLIIWVVPFVLSHTRDAAMRTLTTSHLRQTGAAISMYANMNNGRAPENLQVLVDGDYLPSDEVMRCPVTDELFVYRKLSDRLTSVRNPRATPMAWNPPGRLPGGWIVVLYADGHTESFQGVEAERVMAKINAWQPTTMPGRP